MLETGWRARLKWYSFSGNRQQTHTHFHVQSITHSDQDCDQKTLGHQKRNLTWSKRGRFEEVTFKQRYKGHDGGNNAHIWGKSISSRKNC